MSLGVCLFVEKFIFELFSVKFTRFPGKLKLFVSFQSEQENSQEVMSIFFVSVTKKENQILVVFQITMARILGSGASNGKQGRNLPHATASMSIVPSSSTNQAAKRQRNMPFSKSGLNIFFDTFSDNVTENELYVLRKIDEAWKLKDLDGMFRLINVSNCFNCNQG